MLDLLLLAGGLAVLYLGSEGVVRGASSIARGLHIRPILIGLTVVAFGTSLPELVVSLFSAVEHPDVAIGMVIGSNVANVALILGLAAVIRPVRVDRTGEWRDVPFLLGASLLFTALAAFDGELSRLDGGVMLACLALFMAMQIRSALRSRRTARELGIEIETIDPRRSTVYLVAGLALLALGGVMLESSIPAVARRLGVPEVVVAVTMVALGTSLPELGTSLVATLRNEHDLLLGNVVGSNVLNLLLIVGLTAVIVPLPVSAGLLANHFPWMVGVAVILLPMTWLGDRISRREGALLLAGYVTYVTLTFRAG